MTRNQLTHVCEHCGIEHPVYASELHRGRGIYCCRACAQSYSHSKAYPVTCKVCGGMFYTRIGRKFCCTQCKAAYLHS